MYLPGHFDETRVEELHRIIREYPLGALVRSGTQGLDADHLPFLLDPSAGPRGRLMAHVARANPICRSTRQGEPALVIFRGSDSYISPQWYPSKPETHRHVPTWDYQVIHVHGLLHLVDDKDYVRAVVEQLTEIHEKRAGSATLWRLTDAPAEYLERMLAAIVGIRIEITSMVGKFKLSQNREKRDQIGVIEELRARGAGAAATADAVRRATGLEPGS